MKSLLASYCSCLYCSNSICMKVSLNCNQILQQGSVVKSALRLFFFHLFLFFTIFLSLKPIFLSLIKVFLYCKKTLIKKRTSWNSKKLAESSKVGGIQNQTVKHVSSGFRWQKRLFLIGHRIF